MKEKLRKELRKKLDGKSFIYKRTYIGYHLSEILSLFIDVRHLLSFIVIYLDHSISKVFFTRYLRKKPLETYELSRILETSSTPTLEMYKRFLEYSLGLISHGTFQRTPGSYGKL